MSKPLFCLLTGTLLLACSCAGNNTATMPQPGTAAPQQPPTVQPPPAPPGVPSYRSQANPANGNNAVLAAAEQGPQIPAGAQYTIFCGTVVGEMHVAEANKIRDDLKVTSGLRDWYVIHKETESGVYYGYYRLFSVASDPGHKPDPKDVAEAKRAQTDREKIEKLEAAKGVYPFKLAHFLPLDAPDPTAPPEWDLRNSRGVYTLQIGVYKGSVERKQAAVDAVKQARAQGIEAYYLHGETASLVCVGSFPESSVRTYNADDTTQDQMQPKIYAQETGDPEVDQKFQDMARQSGAKLIRPHYEVVDPKLMALVRQFPNNTVNGMEIKHVVDKHEEYEHTRVMSIPRGDGAANPSVAQRQQNQIMGQADPLSYTPGQGLLPLAPSNGVPAPSQVQRQPAYDSNYRPAIPSVTDRPKQPAPGQLRSLGN